MIKRTAARTSATTVVAQVTDHGARKVTLAHLKAFVQQAEIAGMPDDIEVRFEQKLQTTSPYFDISIRAQVHESTTTDLPAEAEEPDGHHADG